MGLHRDAHHWMFTPYGAECLTCDMHVVLVRPRVGADQVRYYLRWTKDEKAVRLGGHRAPLCGSILADYCAKSPLLQKLDELEAKARSMVDELLESVLVRCADSDKDKGQL